MGKHPKQKRQIIEAAATLLSQRDNDYQRSRREAKEEDLDFLRDHLNEAPCKQQYKKVKQKMERIHGKIKSWLVAGFKSTFKRFQKIKSHCHSMIAFGTENLEHIIVHD